MRKNGKSIKTSRKLRRRLGLILVSAAALLVSAAGLIHAGQSQSGKLRFELSFPESVRKEAADGRLFVILSTGNASDLRRQVTAYDSTPFFGQNIDGMRPGQMGVVDENAYGYPIERLGQLPAGDYYVQGMLNVYTTFHRADGHTVKMHMDQWEGQHFQTSPGNLYSEVQKVHIDPAVGGVVKIELTKVIPPIKVPDDTEYVKHIKFQSPLLSKFWGQPIFIGATVLLPKDYDRNKGVYYPVNYEQGHFSLGNPGGFSERSASQSGATGATSQAQQRANRRAEFSEAWLSDKYPRMMFVTFQHPTPYYDDSYAVDSPNSGPYGQAITQELIPYIESHFRAIPKPYARILSGGSTGGWESLALQILYPDYFGSTYSYCPDPVDFHYFQMVNIYDWTNAWERKEKWISEPIPGERSPDGMIISTMKQQLSYERALGDHGRSGEQWDAWESTYGPLGEDGFFKPIFDPQTGNIDKNVAAYYKDHWDLDQYLKTHWNEIGHRLQGKLHIWVGDADTYFLNDAVHQLEEFLNTTSDPPYGGSIVYGPGKPHCWTGPLSLADQMKAMAQDTAARAPRDADTSWWRF
ncbi:MAG TPA: alpha/beta hydrolase-fold protein [Blastocatellia bacterium]|nr:alpha/beta hydrolase-fold protein [Blastocatellia bacterium]